MNRYLSGLSSRQVTMRSHPLRYSNALRDYPLIVVCKKVGCMGLCAPPSLPVLALRKLEAVPPHVDISCV